MAFVTTGDSSSHLGDCSEYLVEKFVGYWRGEVYATDQRTECRVEFLDVDVLEFDCTLIDEAWHNGQLDLKPN